MNSEDEGQAISLWKYRSSESSLLKFRAGLSALPDS